MSRLSRHELKEDEFRESILNLEVFARRHYKEIIAILAVAVVIVATTVALKARAAHREAEASLLLGQAFGTFNAYVGPPSPNAPAQPGETFATAQQKYRKALSGFDTVVQRFPRTKAASIARYQAGVCQGLLGNNTNAIKKLRQASHASDRNIASLAEFALAGELVKAGKSQEAAKIYHTLVDHPTSTVPKSTALLALADSYRSTQPAQAREIYERLEKEFASDSTLLPILKQRVEQLPK